jgi:acetyl-CoA acetyltransferase
VLDIPSIRGQFAIAALGVSPQGIKLGVSDLELRRHALELALADAGLERAALDGYIHASDTREDLRYLGLSPSFSWSLQVGGASAIMTLMAAAGAIATGQAEVVACVFGMAPTSGYVPGREGWTTIGAYSYGYPGNAGLIGAAATHALHARWYFDEYGATSADLGAAAVALREHACRRPEALGHGKPITLAEHQASRMIVDPLRLLDCCRDSDGAVAVIVTSAKRARQLNPHPVYILGAGYGHNIRNWHNGTVYAHHDDIAPAAAKAFAQAGLTLSDVDVASFYDPFTISVLMQLEAYGFCQPGQAGAFIRDGGIGLDGAIPTNTGGGQLSGFYAAGFTAVVEAIRQLRGEAGAGQVRDTEVALVSGHGLNGGVQNTWSHATLLVGSEP